MTTLIAPRSHDIGGLEVRRAVPSLQARSVGPFVFVDHMGPALFEPGRGIVPVAEAPPPPPPPAPATKTDVKFSAVFRT